ncbi:MAG: ArsR family transcriptional regulator [Thermoplasmataceae archaeon]
MIDDDLEAFISAIENSTRREILRSLIIDQSYALQISRIIGVSQQAINKQLELLEKANLISSAGYAPSSLGARRKIYRPTGFSTLVADYSRNFITVKRYEIPLDTNSQEGHENPQVERPSELIKKIRDVDRQIDELMKDRNRLIATKDQLMGQINSYISAMVPDPTSRLVLIYYVDSMDPEYVSRKLNLPLNLVMQIVETYFR